MSRIRNLRTVETRWTSTTVPDARDLKALYATLEQQVLPAWADRDAWTRMMRASIRMGAELFSADRMVREYFQRLYTAP